LRVFLVCARERDDQQIKALLVIGSLLVACVHRLGHPTEIGDFPGSKRCRRKGGLSIHAGELSDVDGMLPEEVKADRCSGHEAGQDGSDNRGLDGVNPRSQCASRTRHPIQRALAAANAAPVDRHGHHRKREPSDRIARAAIFP
jgi:hypothetical protein